MCRLELYLGTEEFAVHYLHFTVLLDLDPRMMLACLSSSQMSLGIWVYSLHYIISR